MKSSGGSVTLYWYGLNSEPLVETTLAGGVNFAYYYFDGRITNRREWAHFFTPDTYIHDALGNTSIVSGFNGNWDYSDYYPFGGEWAHKSLVGNHYKFTGKERDPESGNDNFLARFYGSSIGRFLSTDPGPDSGFENDRDPQSWNLYTSVRNNPLKYIDPNGEVYCRQATDAEKSSGVTKVCDVSDSQYWQAGKTQRAAYDQAGYEHYFCSCDTATDKAAWFRHAYGGTYEDDLLAPVVAGGIAGGIRNAGRGLLRGLFGGAEEGLSIGSGTAMGQIANVLEKALTIVGDDQINVSSEELAKEAAERFLGQGSREIKQLYGSRAGQVVGRISANGERVVRFDTNAARPHYNFVNKATGGNLHVYF